MVSRTVMEFLSGWVTRWKQESDYAKPSGIPNFGEIEFLVGRILVFTARVVRFWRGVGYADISKGRKEGGCVVSLYCCLLRDC